MLTITITFGAKRIKLSTCKYNYQSYGGNIRHEPQPQPLTFSKRCFSDYYRFKLLHFSHDGDRVH